MVAEISESTHTDFTSAQYSCLIALGSLSTDTSNTQIHSGVKEKHVIEVQMRSWVQPAGLGPWRASYCPSRQMLAGPHSHSMRPPERTEGRVSITSQLAPERRPCGVLLATTAVCAAKALGYFSGAQSAQGRGRQGSACFPHQAAKPNGNGPGERS